MLQQVGILSYVTDALIRVDRKYRKLKNNDRIIRYSP